MNEQGMTRLAGALDYGAGGVGFPTKTTTSGASIVLTTLIFVDGFETSDISRWSEPEPRDQPARLPHRRPQT